MEAGSFDPSTSLSDCTTNKVGVAVSYCSLSATQVVVGLSMSLSAGGNIQVNLNGFNTPNAAGEFEFFV